MNKKSDRTFPKQFYFAVLYVITFSFSYACLSEIQLIVSNNNSQIDAVWPLNWITDPNQRIYGAAFLGVLICWVINIVFNKVIFTKYKNSRKQSIWSPYLLGMADACSPPELCHTLYSLKTLSQTFPRSARSSFPHHPVLWEELCLVCTWSPPILVVWT